MDLAGPWIYFLPGWRLPLTWIIISFQSIKVALVYPAKSLRSEESRSTLLVKTTCKAVHCNSSFHTQA
jgi:hypothetical protein